MKKILLLSPLIILLGACGSQNLKPINTVAYVDLDKFMGDWYVIANIPTFIETDAFNAIETYKMNSDGSIATTFTFAEGAADGKRKQYNPTGFIVDTQSNALWDMQFIWPFSSAYLITHIESDYSRTIIGVPDRSYIWIMSRNPDISDAEYQRLVDIAAKSGYDTSLIKRIPQQWPETTAN